MSDIDKAAVSKELLEKVKKPDLKKTTTKATPSEVALKLKCQDCTHTEGFPTHCEGLQREYEDPGVLVCSICKNKVPAPKHHNKVMKPFIVSAGKK